MSRYLLVCDGLDRPTGPEVKRSLERAFREYGLPRVIRTDNGPPFASVGLGSLTPAVRMVGQAGDSARADRARTPRAERNALSGFTER